MKRLIPLLLLIPILAFGMGRRPPAPQPADSATATYDIATGRLLASTTYGGSRAGQAQDTGSSKVAEALAGKVDADSEFAYVNLTRYAEDQPDVAIEQRLANNEKGAATQLAAAVSGGAPSAVIAGIQNVLTTAIKERADYEKAKANRPKPDTAGISITSFMNGPGSHAATAIMGAKFGDTLAAKTRANYVLNNETTRTDTSNTNDYSGVSNVLRHQLELAKIDLEMAKIKAASQAKPTPAPVVTPPAVGDDDDGTPGDAPTSSVDYDKLPKKNFLYKTSGLSRGVAAILIPKDRPKPVSVTGIGGLRMIENYFSTSEDRHIMRFDGTKGNGPATVRVTYTDGNTEAFNVKDLNGRTDYAPGAYKKPTSTGPVDPPPTTSSLFILEPDKLTLRPDFAAVVRKIDALANVNEPNTDPIFIDAGKVGPYTWGIPKPLGSYPKSVQVEGGPKAMPNTWRLSLVKGAKIPDDVTYHTLIMQTFIQDGATKTYPPTTRE